MQPLFWNLSAFVSAYAQYAFEPLLAPELCGYGGRFYGRAFDPSELLGDRCFLVVGELRFDVPVLAGQLSMAQLYAFADHGELSNIRPDFFTPKSMDGTSIGAGLRLGWANQFNADVYVAKAFCSPTCPPVTLIEGPRDDTRVFFAVTARN